MVCSVPERGVKGVRGGFGDAVQVLHSYAGLQQWCPMGWRLGSDRLQNRLRGLQCNAQ
jgi:hypothetical protein